MEKPMVSIYDKFISALNSQELLPPLHNSTLFTQSSGWNTQEYYGKHYLDETSFPLLITIKKDDGIMFIPATKAKKLAEEVFKLFWQDGSTLDQRFESYKKETQNIDDIYNKIISPDFVEQESFSNLADYAQKIKKSTWEMNALVFFSIYFDKEMCERLLKDVGVKISAERLQKIWEKGTIPISDSFEKRREKYLVDLLENKESWENIGLKCQYFGANYNKVFESSETEKDLKEKFIQFDSIKVRQDYIATEEDEKNKRLTEYNDWLATLTDDEKRLVHYLQVIMELRDERKDYLAKFLVVVFRIAQKLFKEVGVDENLIYFYMFDEIIKGKDYLIENQDNLLKRCDGFTILVNYDGTIDTEYGKFEATKLELEKFFLGQQVKDVDEEIIKGQIGSSGKVQGIVKVIMNLNTESGKFNNGDILVTGMTRPEFVPLMKKSSAVVTDEGGITCHAAIISRELGIPCVIGTKIATHVLKDGDLVEVDAFTGLVRIIKRS